MIITNFKTFKGEHCETTATGTLLKQIGIDLSEPMIFGLGEGLSFIIWKEVSDLFHKAGETEHMEYINKASEILVDLSEKEKLTMQKLKIAST